MKQSCWVIQSIDFEVKVFQFRLFCYKNIKWTALYWLKPGFAIDWLRIQWHLETALFTPPLL